MIWSLHARWHTPTASPPASHHSHARSRPGERLSSETSCALHRLLESEECTETVPLGKTRKIQIDKANKWQLHMLILLIKRRAELHCNVTANKDLSGNEDYKMIMDRDEEYSDRLSLPMVARTSQRWHRHFTSPWGLFAHMTAQRFMVAEMLSSFSLSLARRYRMCLVQVLISCIFCL